MRGLVVVFAKQRINGVSSTESCPLSHFGSESISPTVKYMRSVPSLTQHGSFLHLVTWPLTTALLAPTYQVGTIYSSVMSTNSIGSFRQREASFRVTVTDQLENFLPVAQNLNAELPILFSRLGGDSTITSIVMLFYDNVLADERISFFF